MRHIRFNHISDLALDYAERYLGHFDKTEKWENDIERLGIMFDEFHKESMKIKTK